MRSIKGKYVLELFIRLVISTILRKLQEFIWLNARLFCSLVWRWSM